MNNTTIATIVVASVVGLMGYWFLLRKVPAEEAGIVATGSRAGKFVVYAVLVVLVGFGIYFIYEGLTGDKTRSNNLASTPVDASSTVIVPGAQAPPQSGPQGGNYGIQWWMFIQDWDYKFGEKKPIIRRGSEGVYNPYIYLGETDNTMFVNVSVFPHDAGSAAASEPASVAATGGATDDSFACKVPNVPLQKWFACGVSVSGRNLDIYLDGLLVRSCLLPGVPKTPTGSLEIMPGGGFSGSVIDLFHYSRALLPADAQQFAAKGTKGTSYNALPSKSLFGYKVNLGVIDDSGKQVKSFTL
jgi:hypothetical protein